MGHIYISKRKGINESGAFFREALGFLCENNIDVTWFPSRNSCYNSIKLMEAKGVIVLLEDSSAIIGKGVYTEIEKARKENKPIYILYKRAMDNKFQFYEFTINGSPDESNWVKHVHLLFGVNKTFTITEQFQKLCKVDDNIAYVTIENSDDCIVRINSEHEFAKKEEVILQKDNNLELLLLRR